MKKKTALIICHPDFLPPKKANSRSAYSANWKTEFDVQIALKKLQWDTHFLALDKSLQPLKKILELLKPTVVVNLLEEIDGHPTLESYVVSYLETQDIPFTGCSSKGLLLCRHKGACKYMLKHNGILTPNFNVVYDVRRAKTRLRKVFFPAIVKYANEDASLGIKESSLVYNYKEGIKKIRQLKTQVSGPILIERFIPGREFHLAVFRHKNKQPKFFGAIETVFTRAKKASQTIATEELKWNLKKRRKRKVVLRKLSANKEPVLFRELGKVARKTCKALYLTGFVRIDVRVDQRGRVYVIDVNPNPDLGRGFEMAEILRQNGFSYSELIKLLARR